MQSFVARPCLLRTRSGQPERKFDPFRQGTMSGSEVNESQPALLIVGAAKMNRHLRDDHLQRRPDSTSQKMASVGRSICLAYHHVGVQTRLAVLLRDVAAYESTSTCSWIGMVL